MYILDYSPAFREPCVGIFLSNTPAFFAPPELPLFKSWLSDLEKRSERGFSTGKGKEDAVYYHVGFEQNVPVACGGFYIQASDLQARMAWGMVHSHHHMKGYGRELLNFRIGRIRQMFPSSSIALDTTQFTFRFYEKHGFVVTRITRDFYAPGFHRYDMELRSDNIVL